MTLTGVPDVQFHVYIIGDASSSHTHQEGLFLGYVTNEETEAQRGTVICITQAAIKGQSGI